MFLDFRSFNDAKGRAVYQLGSLNENGCFSEEKTRLSNPGGHFWASGMFKFVLKRLMIRNHIGRSVGS